VNSVKRWVLPSLGASFAMLIATIVMMSGAVPAHAGWVSGTLTTYEGQRPETDRSLHFENRATRDIYMAPTAPDGSFGAQLPPGIYELRAERGAILAQNIVVGISEESLESLGRVSDLAPYSLARVFDFQYIAPSLLITAVPSTANINTFDTAPIPADAVVMPKPHTQLPQTPEMPPLTPQSRNDLPAE
jgi:hypothetical protein